MSNTRLGLVRCEHCGRQFNPHSGARHIPWCEKQQNETRKRRLSVEKRQALERYKWRISYRPSNQISTNNSNNIINQQTSQEQTRRFRIGANKFKKSSINSSATLSSPSASSTTSIGTTSTANNDTQNIKLTTRQRSQFERSNLHRKQQQQQQPSATTTAATAKHYNHSMRQTPVAQLKRSISSLTLTKQQGVWSSHATNRSSSTNKTAAAAAAGSAVCSFAPLSWQKTACLDHESSSQSGKSDATFAGKTSQHNKHRTKSVNDLNNMSEIVETLAKRMDAIYAQNQALLASLSRGGNSNKVEQLDHNRSNLLSSDGDGDDDEEEEEDNGDDNNHHHHRRRRLSHNPREHDGDNDLNELNSGQVNCHHCKACCMKQANYCHKCGCKVYITTPNSTVTVSSESAG